MPDETDRPEHPSLLTSRELAHAVLAACMQGRRTSDVPFLQPEHFPMHRDRAVWKALQELDALGVTGEITPLVEHLKRTATVDFTDWLQYCVEITTEPLYTSSLSLELNAHTVYENARRGEMYRDAVRQANQAMDLTTPLDEPAPDEKHAWSVRELLEAQFPAPRGPWPGIIPVGLTVIGARPKYGKSLLMLQVSAAIGTGGMLFEQRVEKAPVLYYALEDSPRRLKERIARLHIPADADIQFRRLIKPLHLGGLDIVAREAQDYKLIVIDTISRAVPGQDFNRDAALYGDVLGQLQTTALNRDMSIVAVVHTRKPNGMDHDPVDDVLGTTQMTAAADCVLAIYRQGDRSLLRGRARDMEDIDLTLQFDPKTVCWQMIGRTEEVAKRDTEAEILEALRERGKASAQEVAQAVEKDLRNTRRRLLKLCEQGKCQRELVGTEYHYFLPGEPPAAEQPELIGES